MNSEEQPAIKLPIMRSELGKSIIRYVQLENPINKPVKIEAKISNSDNFEITNDRLEIPPREALDVCIKYTPSEIDYQDSCEVIFETVEIGNWKYLFFGAGDPPTRFDEHV